jgi:hypothetical protein
MANSGHCPDNGGYLTQEHLLVKMAARLTERLSTFLILHGAL